MQTKEALAIGTILDSGKRKYIIKSVLGQGGFGITYLATSTIYVENIPMEAQFAIKEHYISSMNERQGCSVAISNENNTEEIKESIDSFIVEAQRLNKLSLSHPGIVRVNECFRANGTAYYVMEYVKGQSLRQYVKQSKQSNLSEEEALKLLKPIAETIGYLHENQLTHLDIKPDNILIRETGDPILIDFGLSKHYNKNGTPTSTIKAAGCSAGYSPLEQYVGITSFTPEADIYALAATLLYMLTGKDPMGASDINEDIIRNSLDGKCSEQTANAIVHAMEKLKENRTHTIEDFIEGIVSKEASETSPGHKTISSKGKQTDFEEKGNMTLKKRAMKDYDHREKIISRVLWIVAAILFLLAFIVDYPKLIYGASVIVLLNIPVTFYYSIKRKVFSELIGGIIVIVVMGCFFHFHHRESDEQESETEMSLPPLKTQEDSVVYALGFFQSEGCKEYLSLTLNVDTLRSEEFLDGLKYGAGITDKHIRLDEDDKEGEKALLAGVRIGNQIIDQMIPGMSKSIYEDSTRRISPSIFMAGFIDGYNKSSSVLSSSNDIRDAQILISHLNEGIKKINADGSVSDRQTSVISSDQPSSSDSPGSVNSGNQEIQERKAVSDDERFAKAEATGDWITIEELGNRGYVKSYYVLAVHYWEIGDENACKKWTEKCVANNVNVEQAKKLLKELR